MTVVETPFFLRKAEALLDPTEREELVLFLPIARRGISDTGSGRCAKGQMGGGGKGKRGGVRVIYYFHSESFPLFLLTVYAKNQKANLTKAERN